jgi:hypothetical protein
MCKPTRRIQKTERKKESIIAFPFAKTNILGEVRSGIICPHALLIWYIFPLPAKKMQKKFGNPVPEKYALAKTGSCAPFLSVGYRKAEEH